MRTSSLYLLSLLTGILLAISWPHTGSLTALAFIAWVPLLLVEDRIASDPSVRPLHVFGCAYKAFFTWNVLSTWWVWNASPGGAVMAIVCNSLLMAIVFYLFHLTKKRLKGKFGPLILISFWLSFELLHYHWDLAWPWLTLGNVFALTTSWVQWYEFTGVFGGSLWVLLVNVLVFALLKKEISKRQYLSRVLITSLVIIFPLLASGYLYITRFVITKPGGGEHTVVVQPNVDPYNEKFSGSFMQQLEKMLKLAESKMTPRTRYVVFPETALTESLWENDLEKTYSITTLRLFLKKHPLVKIVIGASSAYQVPVGQTPSATAKKFQDAEAYYEDYNTALYLDSTGLLLKYHKSKLVPGVEKMPFQAILKPLEGLAIDMGGTTGSLTGQEERTVFMSADSLGVAALICYESVFGEFVGEYVKKGANLLFIITNDGWWKDTPGYKQHLAYGALRAIETRRSIARSANTGISCFINPLGEISQPLGWWKEGAISESLYPSERLTFYTRYGDYIAWLSVVIAGLLFVYSLVMRFVRR